MSRENTTSTSAGDSPLKKPYLPKLSEEEKALLNTHLGCRRCRTFYTDHDSRTCPMITAKSWPDTTRYTPLTENRAIAAKPHTTVAMVYSEDLCDADTDSYVPIPPFTIPHLYAQLDLMGPAVEDFPLSIKAMLDISSPAVIISSGLVNQLGL
ncbi:hypothetical protein M422DRAFT_253439 [Sphaerobolus stellatus SS14]|uniref:Unplaced genomic scaffold SPHSTscaffold_49, whole genome shotgun sequence n=1 Tax=Sphaerobolus stellatus (strain SS14) TaxID=990650 RepID=A0A0C9VMV4_SPHS4|nr:hypothetical protein M422DRAFT_253439 [Sphaerobolus stellatus SS14]